MPGILFHFLSLEGGCGGALIQRGMLILFSNFSLNMFISFYAFNYLFFRFKEGTFRLNVLPRSKLNIICPHVAVSLVEKDDVDNKPNYENFWRVDNASYQSCNVNTNVTENKIFLRCDNPRQMQFEKLVFQSHSADSSRVFVKGRTYYFICKFVLCIILIFL